MPHYRLYHIRRDRFVGVDDLEADDDVQAARQAAALNLAAAGELWCDSRKITEFAPGTLSARGEE